mgnify:FL=1
MSWTFTYKLGTAEETTVTLPINPRRVLRRFTKRAQVRGLFKDGFPIVWDGGQQTFTITLEGYLYEEGKSIDDLETSYIDKFEEMYELWAGATSYVDKARVKVQSPGGRYDGYYFLTRFESTEAARTPAIYEYRMEFTKIAPKDW